MIKRFNTAANPILSSVIDTLEASLHCSKFRQMKDKIAVHTLDDLTFHNGENRLVVEDGFGACSIRDYGLGGLSIAIVINQKNCSTANLTEREIRAVGLHELGHILNEPDVELLPTFEFCFIHQTKFNREVLDKAQSANELKMEVYADSYAKQHGYGPELISTLNKQNECFEQKIGYYAERMDGLQKAGHLEGKIISSKTY